MNTNSYSSIRNFPLYSFLWNRPVSCSYTGGNLLVLPFFSEDNGSTKAALPWEVYSLVRTKLLDIIQKDLPDYQLRRKKSLYKAPENVYVSLSVFTCRELPMMENSIFLPSKFMEVMTKLKRYWFFYWS